MSAALAWGPLGTNLWAAAATAAAVLLATFCVAAPRGLHRLVDIAWGLAFTAVAVLTYLLGAGHGDPARRALVCAATAVWGLRLAAHLAHRGRGHGEDPRYRRMLDRARGNRARYALRVVYLPQALLVWLVSLPVQVGGYQTAALGPLAWAGALVWAAGVFFEAVGDRQLAAFKADPGNRGRVMDRGLWRYTRHPNYFGDFLVWWGILLIGCGSWQALWTVVSPLAMTLLLTLGSGKPLLERHMADRPGYSDYLARTSGFLPLPPRRRPNP